MTWLSPSRGHAIAGHRYAIANEVTIPLLSHFYSWTVQSIRNRLGRIGAPIGSENPESCMTSNFGRKHNFGFVRQEWYD